MGLYLSFSGIYNGNISIPKMKVQWGLGIFPVVATSPLLWDLMVV